MSHIESELERSIAWLTKLREDLKAGRAKEVPAEGHVWRHIWRKEEVFTPAEIPMLKIEECVDFLECWGVYFWIATCPKTGIRFIEETALHREAKP